MVQLFANFDTHFNLLKFETNLACEDDFLPQLLLVSVALLIYSISRKWILHDVSQFAREEARCWYGVAK